MLKIFLIYPSQIRMFSYPRTSDIKDIKTPIPKMVIEGEYDTADKQMWMTLLIEEINKEN